MFKLLIKKTAGVFGHIRKYPIETIELILAFLLVIWGILTMLPASLLNIQSAYGDVYIGRAIFGLGMLYSAAPLIWWRVHGIHDYIYTKSIKRRRHLFYCTLVWFYISVLRAIIAPMIPPFFLLYAALGAFTFICYLRLGK